MIRRPTFLFALLTFIALIACADESHVTANVPMPLGFESVHLGMTFDELKAVRPDLRRDKFATAELNAYEPLQGNDFFTSAVYEFAGGKLAKIIFSRSGTAEEIAGRCSALVDGSIMKWGEPAEKSVGIVRRHPVTGADHEYPLLTWHRPDATIVVNCISTVDLKNAPNFYTLAIIDPELPARKAWPAEVRRDATPADFKKVMGELRARQVPVPLFQ